MLARECLVCTTKYTAEKMFTRNLFLTSLSYQLAKFAITFSLDDEVLLSVISTVDRVFVVGDRTPIPWICVHTDLKTGGRRVDLGTLIIAFHA